MNSGNYKMQGSFCAISMIEMNNGPSNYAGINSRPFIEILYMYNGTERTNGNCLGLHFRNDAVRQLGIFHSMNDE